MGYKSPSLREQVRTYPAEQNLSSEAAQVFNQTFREHEKSDTIKAAFTAAKKAVEKIPKERRYKSEEPAED